MAVSVPATTVEWRDGKRYLWILGAVIPLIPFAAWGLVEATGPRGLVAPADARPLGGRDRRGLTAATLLSCWWTVANFV